ncbi:hypothetical protein EYF80_008427 [Liparis tanakae]|uniref:Uncharacterized protein n=1 Tax=Liparis tanakae TaxID=230148 RepID=A0A4Z2IU82_9TELE|nr:hypothetical protein EYF80_008427 [Liparis tanakae]
MTGHTDVSPPPEERVLQSSQQQHGITAGGKSDEIMQIHQKLLQFKLQRGRQPDLDASLLPYSGQNFPLLLRQSLVASTPTCWRPKPYRFGPLEGREAQENQSQTY